MTSGTVFILSISSDIGRALATIYRDDGWTVVGTCRKFSDVQDLKNWEETYLLSCDVGDPDSIRQMILEYSALNRPWDLFISAVGVLDPIGPWTSIDFDAWEYSVRVNSLAQLRVLHGMYPYRRLGQLAQVAFLAGGGTNNPFTNFSAYCLGKIALIKMCELIDDEVSDVNAFIIGPGFMPTKIHEQTIASKVSAGEGYEKTMKFRASEKNIASYHDLYDCIIWCVRQGRSVAGGRNFALVHDPWQADGDLLAKELELDPNKHKLRRSGNIVDQTRGEKTI